MIDKSVKRQEDHFFIVEDDQNRTQILLEDREERSDCLKSQGE